MKNISLDYKTASEDQIEQTYPYLAEIQNSLREWLNTLPKQTPFVVIWEDSIKPWHTPKIIDIDDFAKNPLDHLPIHYENIDVHFEITDNKPKLVVTNLSDFSYIAKYHIVSINPPARVDIDNEALWLYWFRDSKPYIDAPKEDTTGTSTYSEFDVAYEISRLTGCFIGTDTNESGTYTAPMENLEPLVIDPNNDTNAWDITSQYWHKFSLKHVINSGCNDFDAVTMVTVPSEIADEKTLVNDSHATGDVKIRTMSRFSEPTLDILTTVLSNVFNSYNEIEFFSKFDYLHNPYKHSREYSPYKTRIELFDLGDMMKLSLPNIGPHGTTVFLIPQALHLDSDIALHDYLMELTCYGPSSISWLELLQPQLANIDFVTDLPKFTCDHMRFKGRNKSNDIFHDVRSRTKYVNSKLNRYHINLIDCMENNWRDDIDLNSDTDLKSKVYLSASNVESELRRKLIELHLNIVRKFATIEPTK